MVVISCQGAPAGFEVAIMGEGTCVADLLTVVPQQPGRVAPLTCVQSTTQHWGENMRELMT